MQKLGFNLLLFLLFLLEGTILSYFSIDRYGYSFTVVPRFTLILIIFISIFYHRHYGLIAGIILGLLTDIVFGKGIGIHLGGLAFIGYASGWLMYFFQPSFLVFTMIEGIGLILYEFYLYGVHQLFQLVSVSFEWALSHYLLPSILANLLIALVFFKPLRQLVIYSQEEEKA